MDAFTIEALEKCTSPEQKQTAKIFCNLVEDEKIKQEANAMLGPNILDVIRNEIRRECYEKEENVDPFEQLATAFVIYGTEEAPKEHFTSEEAHDIYKRIAPEFREIVANSDEKAIVDAVIRWSEMSQPLLETPEQKQNKAQEVSIGQKQPDELGDIIASATAKAKANAKPKDLNKSKGVDKKDGPG